MWELPRTGRPNLTGTRVPRSVLCVLVKFDRPTPSRSLEHSRTIKILIVWETGTLLLRPLCTTFRGEFESRKLASSGNFEEYN